MKAGVRKRQEEILKIVDALYVAATTTDEEAKETAKNKFDESYIKKSIADGLYLNKCVSQCNYHPIWFGILLYLADVRIETEEMLLE